MRFGFVVLFILLAACASTPPDAAKTESAARTAQKATASDNDKGIVCVKETPVGSMLPQKRCTTPDEREQQRRDTEKAMRQESYRPR